MNQRHQAILHIITTKDIFTQEDLTRELAAAGFSVAQATISRDINKLRLSKSPTESGSKYVAPILRDEPANRLSRIFRDGLVSVEYAGNMLVLRTLSGLAMAVGSALDDMNLPEVLGAVAGDDTIICVVKSETEAAALARRLTP